MRETTGHPQANGISPIGFLPDSGTFQRSKSSNFLLLLRLFRTPNIMASRKRFNLEEGSVVELGKGFATSYIAGYSQVHKINLKVNLMQIRSCWHVKSKVENDLERSIYILNKKLLI